MPVPYSVKKKPSWQQLSALSALSATHLTLKRLQAVSAEVTQLNSILQQQQNRIDVSCQCMNMFPYKHWQCFQWTDWGHGLRCPMPCVKLRLLQVCEIPNTFSLFVDFAASLSCQTKIWVPQGTYYMMLLTSCKIMFIFAFIYQRMPAHKFPNKTAIDWNEWQPMAIILIFLFCFILIALWTRAIMMPSTV